jgi:hypothetical protein
LLLAHDFADARPSWSRRYTLSESHRESCTAAASDTGSYVRSPQPQVVRVIRNALEVNHGQHRLKVHPLVEVDLHVRVFLDMKKR